MNKTELAMWSQQIAFPRTLRSVRLAGPHGEISVIHGPQQTPNNAIDPPRGAITTEAKTVEVEPARSELNKGGGSEQAEAAIEKLWQEVTARLAEIENRQQQSLVEMKQVAIEVAVAIASRILMVQIPAGDQDVTKMVKEAIADFDKPRQLELFLNPDDLGNLDQSACASAFAAHKSVALHSDPTVERGNCRVESDTYSTLFDWRERLEQWRHELLQAVTVNGN